MQSEKLYTIAGDRVGNVGSCLDKTILSGTEVNHQLSFYLLNHPSVQANKFLKARVEAIIEQNKTTVERAKEANREHHAARIAVGTIMLAFRHFFSWAMLGHISRPINSDTRDLEKLIAHSNPDGINLEVDLPKFGQVETRYLTERLTEMAEEQAA